MQEYYVYRYIDKKTNEIMYIGKTGQLFVTNRLDQHKTDNVGVWAEKNEHYIDFITLPREEDMTYLESYLIRKHKPQLNIVLMAQYEPPFSIEIDESKWKKLDEYLKEKEMAKTLPSEIFINNIKAIEESNNEFNKTVSQIASTISMKDRNFIKKICFINNLDKGFITIPKNHIIFTFSTHNIEEVADRMISYGKETRISGTVNTIRRVAIFDKYEIKDENIVFTFNAYFKKILAVI